MSGGLPEFHATTSSITRAPSVAEVRSALI